MSLPDIKNSKIGIIYVYYERKDQQKNQTNLTFFIKYGLNEKLWLNLNIETLIVINGYYTEVIIPQKPNINLLAQENCSDWEGWYNGIKFYENKYKKPIWDIFDYLCLINAGAFGPIYEENTNDHWLVPFYNRLVKYNAVLCSPCMSFLPETNISGIGPKVVPIFSLIQCTKNIINLLTNVKINMCDKPCTQKEIKYFNTVLGKKLDKIDACGTGEYGLSRILLENGYKITSLLYDFECCDPKYWNINGNIEPDRFNTFNGQNVPLTTIFIKNIWRWEKSYVSIPVLYNKCKNYFYNKLNMTSIFDNNIDINNNYDLISINNTDKERGYWNSKQEYYHNFGYAEENLLFNKPSKNFNGCLIYAHYDPNDMVRDYVIQTIKVFRYLGYDILFFTACKKLRNVSFLPCKVFYTSNDGAGTDWKIWLYGCTYLKNNNINYEYIFLLNDSIILPVNGIENFEKTIIKMRASSDFWGHWESNELEWHIVGTPIEFKYSMIYDIISFIKKRLPECSTRMDFIFKVEIKFAKYLVDKGYKWNTVIKRSSLDNSVVCPVFNPVNLYKWIINPSTFAIKWKYSLSYLNKYSISKEFNYLTKYLYYGKYGIISEGERAGIFAKSQDF